MIAFESKQMDIDTNKDILAILEIAVRQYAWTKDERYLPEIERLDKWSAELSAKIATHDYTEDEKRLKRAIFLSPELLALTGKTR